ncbi:MAG TPA: hypothetical protein VLG37_01940 [Candidatus Saccharimonadales bacterium]|nr:hypothetical protein [Candidatus Saccharimonadales bacterium]
MKTSGQPPLYIQVIKVTHVYLGSAAERFVARQVQNHLHKQPEGLSREDLKHLIDWIRVAVSLITEDSDIVEEYIGELQHLANGKTRRKRTEPNYGTSS